MTGRLAVFCACLAALVVVSRNPAYARQDADTLQDSTARAAGDSVEQMERLVVTATRTSRALSDLPVSMSVIGRDRIDVAPAHNIEDFLLLEPGINVRRSVGMGEGIPGDVIIRGVPGGFAATRVLILVDGIPTNVSGTPFLIMNQVPLEAVEKIEVVKGPFSCLYGANAFGGVINVITREGTGRPSVRLTGELGNMALYDIAGWSGGGGDRLGYSVTGGARGTGNYLAGDTAIERHGQAVVRKNPENHDYREYRFQGKTKWWINRNLNLALQVRYFDSELGFGKTKSDTLNNPLDSITDDIVTFGRLITVGPALSWQPSSAVSVRFGGFARRFIGTFQSETFDPAAFLYQESVWKSNSDDGQAELQVTARAGTAQTITAGADYLVNVIDFGATYNRETGGKIPGSTGGRDRIDNAGLYVQDEIRLFDRWTTIPAFRFDYHSLIGPVFSPKLSSSVRTLDWLTVRASGGRAFRAPALSELYLPALDLQPTIRMVSNPDLLPEYIWAFDGGIDATLLPWLTLDIGGFYNSMKDLISPRISGTFVDNAINITVSFQNIHNAWSAGADAGCEIRPAPWLTLAGGYTWTESMNTATETALDYVPRHKATTAAYTRFPLGILTLDNSVSWTGVSSRVYLDWQSPPENLQPYPTDPQNAMPIPTRLKAYSRFDASARLSWKDHLWLGLGCQNALDRKYEESGGTWAPGRIFFVRLGGGF